ncbi:MAG: DUF6503 family protein [Marinoscillum sp.]|uniref:DUF6503 family protein n=1 Tax=Marinoscillum sp. TaxID=2024838 RepID=UPI003300842C
MKYHQLIMIFISALVMSCGGKDQTARQEKAPPQFQNKGHELIYIMTQKAGDYATLWNKRDVVYTYTYRTPDNKADISTEKLLFDGELSYGLYQIHERTFPDLEGPIEQGYDGKEYWLKHNGHIQSDTTRLKRVAFNRPTNFYWFAMFQKLLDPGLNYEYLGEETIDNTPYDVVKITFTSTDEKPTDVYQLYINQKTALVDQFLFTVADFGVMETPNLMKVEYEQIEDLLIPTKRRYKKSTWEAAVSDAPWITVTWTNIQFNTGLSTKDFLK